MVAHFLDMEGVTGSSPVRPTNEFCTHNRSYGADQLPLCRVLYLDEKGVIRRSKEASQTT